MNVLQAICMTAFYVSILGVDKQLQAKPLETLIKLCESAVRKKMAAVHFTTIPFEPNTANYT